MRLLGSGYLFVFLWVAYVVYWQIMAGNVKTTQRLEPAASRVFRMMLILPAVVLLADPRIPLSWLHRRFLPGGDLSFFGGAAITVSGLLFSVWARSHLGRNWSRSVTIKEDHELITTGPYALVRHPIYTGLLAGFLGTAVAIGEFRGLVSSALVFIALWAKLRLEERWMRIQFGAPYEEYSHRVAALVPFVL